MPCSTRAPFGSWAAPRAKPSATTKGGSSTSRRPTSCSASARSDGRRCVVGGEDFTLRGGSPNEAGLRKSVYAEELACTYRVPLVRLHQGAGGSVAGSGSKTVGTPVNAPPRFASVARAMATVPVASAGLGAVAGLPAARLVASHFFGDDRNDAGSGRGPRRGRGARSAAARARRRWAARRCMPGTASSTIW